MKKIVNGQLVDMTAEEIAEMEKHQAEMPIPEPTPEERIAELEREGIERDIAIMELAAMLSGGV